MTLVVRDKRQLKELNLFAASLSDCVSIKLVDQMPHAELLSLLVQHDGLIAESGGFAPPGILAIDAVLMRKFVFSTVPQPLLSNEYYAFLDRFLIDSRSSSSVEAGITLQSSPGQANALVQNKWQVDILRLIRDLVI